MTNIFSGKTMAKEKVEDDFLAGSGILDTDIYLAKIKTAYIGKAASSDARNVTLLLDINGKEHRSQIWVSNRNGDVTYKDKRTGEDKNLPGFNQINSLCLLVDGQEMGAMDVEELTVKLYDFEAKKELPQAVDCFSSLHGQEVMVAMQRQTVDKTAKNEATGSYEPTGETRDQNEVVKFFANGPTVTISEVAEFVKSLGGDFDDVINDGDVLKAISRMDADAGTYAEKWLDRNKGQTYDKSSGKKATGTPFSGNSNAVDKPKAKTSLFD
jgi:hypothetical protein